MSKQWITAAVVGLAVLTSLILMQARAQAVGDVQAQSTQTNGAVLSNGDQPFDFPHDIHVTDFQIDCQYCHFSAERSSSAGIPPVQTCMGCHAFVAGTERQEDIVLLREYANQGEAIPWTRIYKVHDHVQFPHMRHVSAGVDCASCHGDVGEIGVIREVVQPLTMGWCLSCHVEMDAARDCTACHY